MIGVIGPGTGHGVSGLILADDGGWITLGSEGGHAEFAPADEREVYVLQYAWRELAHVSAERLVSCPGLELIYRALAERSGISAATRWRLNVCILKSRTHASDPVLPVSVPQGISEMHRNQSID